MYEALRTICACYLRSDREGIIDTLHAYRAADALYNIAKAEVALLHPHHTHDLCKHADGTAHQPTIRIAFQRLEARRRPWFWHHLTLDLTLGCTRNPTLTWPVTTI